MEPFAKKSCLSRPELTKPRGPPRLLQSFETAPAAGIRRSQVCQTQRGWVSFSELTERSVVDTECVCTVNDAFGAVFSGLRLEVSGAYTASTLWTSVLASYIACRRGDQVSPEGVLSQIAKRQVRVAGLQRQPISCMEAGLEA